MVYREKKVSIIVGLSTFCRWQSNSTKL